MASSNEIFSDPKDPQAVWSKGADGYFYKMPADWGRDIYAESGPGAMPDDGGVQLADYFKSIMSGSAGLVSGAGWLTKKFPLMEAFGGAIENLGNDAVDYWNESMSPGAKAELSKNFIQKNDQGQYEWGDAGIQTALLTGAQSLPSMAGGMGAGAAIAKTLQVFANPIGRAALVATIDAAKGAEAGSALAVKAAQAAKKLKLVDDMLSATGFGAGEAIVSVPQAGAAVEQQISKLPLEKLQQSERWREVYDSADDMPEAERQRYATDTIAKEAASQAGWETGLTTFLLGGGAGAYYGRLLNRGAAQKISSALSKLEEGSLAGRIGMGAAVEGAQEFGQSGAQQLAQNRAVIDYGDPNLDLWDQVLEQAVGGAVVGAPLGGAFGAFAGKGDNQEPATPLDTGFASTLDKARGLSPDQAMPTGPPDDGSGGGGPPAGPADFEVGAEGVARRPGQASRQTAGEQGLAANINERNAERSKLGLPPVTETDSSLTHESDETGQHIIRSKDGELQLQESGKYLQVKRIDVAEGARGQGQGTAMMERAAKEATDAGLTLASDVAVTPDAQRIYAKLEAKGYTIQRNDAETNPDTGNLISKDPRVPVFEVTSVPEERAQTQQRRVLGKQETGTNPGRDVTLKIRGVAGTTEEAKHPNGKGVAMHWAVVEAGDLTVSNSHITGQPNRDYPQDLQPRQRKPRDIAATNLKPEDVHDAEAMLQGGSTADGAPIIGPDGNVESGNGRMMTHLAMGLRGNLEEYHQKLIARAQELGISAEQLQGFKNPVLVRVRATPMDAAERKQFAIDANAQPGGAKAAPKLAAKLDRAKGFIGWAQEGGKATISQNDIYDAGSYAESEKLKEKNRSGSWIGSEEWKGRPRASKGAGAYELNEKEALAAIDKAQTGERLNPAERRFIDYAVEVIDRIDEEAAAKKQEADAAAAAAAEYEARLEPGESRANAAAIESASTLEALDERIALLNQWEQEAEAEREAEIDAIAKRETLGETGQEEPGQAATGPEDQGNPAPEKAGAGQAQEPAGGVAAKADLFGQDTSRAQALADAKREKDKARNAGQESVETGDPTDLFSQARQQTDLLDQAKAVEVPSSKPAMTEAVFAIRKRVAVLEALRNCLHG